MKKEAASHAGPATLCIHEGEELSAAKGSVVAAVFNSVTYTESLAESDDYHEVRYARLNNTPNLETLHRKFAQLERAEDALVLSSGMAAVSHALLALTAAGDHVLAPQSLYGGTYAFLTTQFQRLGRDYTFCDIGSLESLEKSATEKTKLLYIESISNPCIQVPPLNELLKFAKRRNLITVVDNTFATPLGFKPIEFGFDLSVHSATKYLNGHSDVVAGAVMGSKRHVNLIRQLANLSGPCLDAHAAAQLNRGLKTFPLRFRQQCASAEAVATFLASHPKVEKVFSLTSEDLNKKGLAAPGAVLSFEIRGGLSSALQFISSLRYFAHAPSLGSVESLVTLPSRSSHKALSKEDRIKAGVSDSMIRLSIGIEDVEDLLADLAANLDAV